MLGRPSLPLSSSANTTGSAEKPAAASQQLTSNTIWGLTPKSRKSRSLDHCWISAASLLRSAAASHMNTCTAIRNITAVTLAVVSCRTGCPAASLLAACTSSYAGAAHILHEYSYCTSTAAACWRCGTYYTYVHCSMYVMCYDSCCRENLAQPVVCILPFAPWWIVDGSCCSVTRQKTDSKTQLLWSTSASVILLESNSRGINMQSGTVKKKKASAQSRQANRK